MSGIVIVTAEVRDEPLYAEIVKRAPEVVARHGGQYLVRGGNIEQVSGDWTTNWVVVIRFDSLDQARTFLDSPELSEILSEINNTRDELADLKIILVEGL